MGVRDTALASDDFNRADGGLGTNWATLANHEAPAIVGNLVQDSSNASGSASGARYSAVSAPADQWSQVEVRAAGVSSSRTVSVYARADSAADNTYRLRAAGPLGAGAVLELLRRDAGVQTTLASVVTAINVGDTISIECEGTTIRGFINSMLHHSVTDATYATGSFGTGVAVPAAGALTGAQLDNWSGGTFVVASGPRFRDRRRAHKVRLLG